MDRLQGCHCVQASHVNTTLPPTNQACLKTNPLYQYALFTRREIRRLGTCLGVIVFGNQGGVGGRVCRIIDAAVSWVAFWRCWRLLCCVRVSPQPVS